MPHLKKSMRSFFKSRRGGPVGSPITNNSRPLDDDVDVRISGRSGRAVFILAPLMAMSAAIAQAQVETTDVPRGGIRASGGVETHLSTIDYSDERFRPVFRAEFLAGTEVDANVTLEVPPPSFEGKVVIRGSDGRWHDIVRPGEEGPLPELPPGADIFLADGSETALAINVGDDNNLIGVQNPGFLGTPVLKNSIDGNVTWTTRTFPNGAGTYTGSPFDPWANEGNSVDEFFATLIRRDTASANTHSVIARSVNKGAAWALFFERAVNTFQDREMVDVDKTTALGGGPGAVHDNKVYLAWDDFGVGGAGYVGSFLTIVSAGGTFLNELTISTAANFNGSKLQPVAGTTDGQVYLMGLASSGGGANRILKFHEITGAGAGTFLNKSSFSFPTTGQALGVSTRWGVNGHRINSHMAMDIDRTQNARRGYLYVVSNRNPNQGNPALDQGDVWLSISTDGALTWSHAMIPGQAANKTTYFSMIDVDDNGWIHVAYYQNETGTVNNGVLNAATANVYYTLSKDGGTTWSAPVQINDAANTLQFFEPPPNLAGQNYYLYGDYQQIKATCDASGNGKAYILWSGYNKNRSDVFLNDKRDRTLCTTLTDLGTCKGAAGGQTDLGPTPFFSHKGPGADFIKASATTRTFNNAGIVGQACPFAMAMPMPALPPGAVIIAEYVQWNYLINGVAPAFDGPPNSPIAPRVNGFAVSGAICGTGAPDLCWSKDGGVAYIQSLPPGVIIYGGPNTIDGMCDKPLGPDPNAYGEGVTLLTVFEVPGDPLRNVDVYCGYTSTESGPVLGTATANLAFSSIYIGGDLHFFTNALDGQNIFTDDFFVNTVLASGAVAGTDVVGNAWVGKLGPNGPPFIENLYDHANDDISVFKVPGVAAMTFDTVRVDDCIGHSFAAVSFNQIQKDVKFSQPPTDNEEDIASNIDWTGSGSASWQLRAAIQDPRTVTGVEGASASLIGNKIYVSHGFRGSESALLSVYDIPTDTWTHGGVTAPDALVIRSEMAGGTALGKHYAIGGRSGPNADVEEFDPTSNTWTTKAPMLLGPRGGVAAASWNNKIYAVGGRDGATFGSGIIFTRNEEYDAASNTWTVKAPMLVAVSDNYATVAQNGKVYVFGGATSPSTVTNVTQIYDIASNSWSFGFPMPTARGAAMAGVCGGNIYVFGGFDPGSGLNLDITEVYDPINDSWLLGGPTMVQPVSEMAQGVTYNGSEIYSIGSGIFGPALSVVQVLTCQAPNVVVADDFISNGRPVTGVRWWGSEPNTVSKTCDPPGTCAAGFVNCGGDPNCFCFSRPDGTGNCAPSVSCAGLVLCPNGDSDCPAGTKCFVDTCCVDPVCTPNCTGLPPASSQPQPGELSTTGVRAERNRGDQAAPQLMDVPEYANRDMTTESNSPKAAVPSRDEGAALELGPCGPGNGDCCIANGTPGCDDPSCCNFVCGRDPFCCTNVWDDLCRDEALLACAVCIGGPPPNDDCINAAGPLPVPSFAIGTTDGATIDSGFPSPCGAAFITGPGVWYTVIGTGNTMTASLCTVPTTYDSQLSVYCPDCATALCVDGNDDFCGPLGLQSEVSWCSQAGQSYLILVHGFGGASGPFDLTVSDDGTPCPNPPSCGVPPSGAIDGWLISFHEPLVKTPPNSGALASSDAPVTSDGPLGSSDGSARRVSDVRRAVAPEPGVMWLRSSADVSGELADQDRQESGEVAASFNPADFEWDDGTAENCIGVNDGVTGSAFGWANQFTNASGVDIKLTDIEVAFGCAGPGALAIGDAVDGVIWVDAAATGNIVNATKLIQWPLPGGVHSTSALSFATHVIPGGGVTIPAGAEFYVGVGDVQTSIDSLMRFPASLDETSPVGKSWAFFDPNNNVFDPDNLAGQSVDLIDNFGLPGNWLIRANGGPVAPLAGEPLGLYFCPPEAVAVADTTIPACDGAVVKEYFVQLDDCCLIHANVDSRSGSIPAQPHAFREERCFYYDLDIQAVVGHRYDMTPDWFCIEPPILTGNFATADFWGWHTTAIENGVRSALSSTVTMGPAGEWIYGPWTNITPTCGSPNMAFELLTSDTGCAIDDDCFDCDVCTCDTCVAGSCSNTPGIYGDVNCDGTVDIFDLFCILNCFSGVGPCSLLQCDIEPCQGNGSINIFDLFAVLNAFSGIDPCGCP